MKATVGCVKIAVLGGPKVGKSAVTVRFLTKRFIGEYSSDTDMSYQSVITHEDGSLKLEILDCATKSRSCNHVCRRRYEADAFLVVYDVTQAGSLDSARKELEALSRTPSALLAPVCLLGNKMDLEHLRAVDEDEACQLALQFGCLHRQVSAAESHVTIHAALSELLQDALLLQKQRAKHLKRRRGILGNVSRRLGNVFRRKSLEELLLKRKLPLQPVVTDGRRSL